MDPEYAERRFRNADAMQEVDALVHFIDSFSSCLYQCAEECDTIDRDVLKQIKLTLITAQEQMRFIDEGYFIEKYASEPCDLDGKYPNITFGTMKVFVQDPTTTVPVPTTIDVDSPSSR